jgi:hypothetical protein
MVLLQDLHSVSIGPEGLMQRQGGARQGRVHVEPIVDGSVARVLLDEPEQVLFRFQGAGLGLAAVSTH